MSHSKSSDPRKEVRAGIFSLQWSPFGDATFSSAVDDALAQRGGDALLNVTVSNSLYGFVPIYNVYSFTCTSVQGVAVKFKPVTAPTAADGHPDVIPVANQRQ